MKKLTFPLWMLFLGAVLMAISCKKVDGVEGDWSIPKEDVRDGGPGKDGIPSVDNPQFSDTSSAVDFLNDGDLVVGFADGEVVRAYPHALLDWHEIVNDEVNGTAVAITYCPLTGSGIAWDREIEGETTTFGVSGLLYESNLIPYDRKTNSNWSQMRLDCVNGSLLGQEVKTHPTIETTWGSWKAMYPNTQVMTTETGYDRNYGSYPYGDYRTNHDYLVFPVANEDVRLPEKQRVYGVISNGKAKVYTLEAFSNVGNGSTILIEDNVQGEDVLVVGNEDDNWVVSFMAPSGSNGFVAVQDSGAVILSDTAGNLYDVFGRVVDGPDLGGRLTGAKGYIGYWFAWATFYPEVGIY